MYLQKCSAALIQGMKANRYLHQSPSTRKNVR
jgi:hypothetical protein